MHDTAYSQDYEHALRLAAIKHAPQMRKGTAVPYITHPVQVWSILQHYGFSPVACTSGLLHDVVEDQGVTLAEIEARFGSGVADIVAVLTERKKDGNDQPRPWEVRKLEALEKVRTACLDAVAVKAADTLHNARTVALDARRDGPSVWQRFNRGPMQMLDYYGKISDLVGKRMPNHPLAQELEQAVDDLARAIEEVGQ